MFQDIADANGGTRASGTAGYEASVRCRRQASREGFLVTIQNFDFPFFQEVAPPKLEQVSPNRKTYGARVDFFTMTYSGSGDATANVQPVDAAATPSETSTRGCETSDFRVRRRPDRTVQRGTCTFRAKALNARAAGA